MSKIKQVFERIGRLPRKTKIKTMLILAFVVCLTVSAGVYAWFNAQKKAAEMFKVEFPNALYINAGHREDRVNFELGAIDVEQLDGYETDEYGNIIYFAPNTYDTPLYLFDNGVQQFNEDDSPKYDTENGVPHKVKSKQYAFSVSGAGMDSFILQLGHTTNNKLNYRIYNAEQFTTIGAAITAATWDEVNPGTGEEEPVVHYESIVKYDTSANSHTEGQPVVAYDPFDDSEEANPTTLYYVKKGAALTDLSTGKGYLNQDGSSKLAKKQTSDTYYKETYKTYTNVQDNAVPLYCQAVIPDPADEDDLIEIDENKGFSRYFILEVTWQTNELGQSLANQSEDKETDMLYLSAKRN
ncbi:MAG: hypothetical protein IKP47_11465 [Ruminococcus sp.]|nr:hypothetical protein [Ruminococcus sp.]